MKTKKPQTSIDARNSLEPDKIRLMYKKIQEALNDLGPSTFEQIADYWQEDSQRIWRRMNEAMKLGLCHRKGDKRALKSGRLGFVWHLGPGKDVTKQRVKSPKGKSIVDYSRALIQPSINSSLQAKLF